MVAGQFKGGKKGARDRTYGLENRDGFEEFRRWWHRVGKPKTGGADINSRPMAEECWKQWDFEGRPKVKFEA